MGAIHYKMENERYVLADDCHVTGNDGVEELDCTVRLFNLLRRNGYQRIEQITAAPGMAFFGIEGIGMKGLRELLTRLDFLGLRLSDWEKDQSVEDYYQIYVAAAEQKRAEEWDEIEKDIQDERREKARLRARERRARLKAANGNIISAQGAIVK